MKIKTDHRIELMSVVAYLSDIEVDRFLDKSKNLYSEAIDTYFQDFRTHPVIRRYAIMWEKDLCWQSVVTLSLYLNDDITLPGYMTIGFHEEFDYLIGDDSSPFQELITYVELLHDFFIQTNFMNFYQEEVIKNDSYISYLDKKLTNYEVVPILEKYIGATLLEGHVFLSQLLKSAYGLEIETPHGKVVYCVLSSFRLKEAETRKDVDEVLVSTVWHEFLHPVINPLSEKHFPKEMTDEQCESFCQLNESILLAVTFRLCLQEEIAGTPSYDWYFAMAKRNRAPMAEEMYLLLPDYETGDYKSIVEFHPAFAEAYSKETKN